MFKCIKAPFMQTLLLSSFLQMQKLQKICTAFHQKTKENLITYRPIIIWAIATYKCLNHLLKLPHSEPQKLNLHVYHLKILLCNPFEGRGMVQCRHFLLLLFLFILQMTPDSGEILLRFLMLGTLDKNWSYLLWPFLNPHSWVLCRFPSLFKEMIHMGETGQTYLWKFCVAALA